MSQIEYKTIVARQSNVGSLLSRLASDRWRYVDVLAHRRVHALDGMDYEWEYTILLQREVEE